MKYAGILLAAALVIGASGLSFAQQTINGKVASVDQAGGKISIQISGTSGADASTAPTPFKVQDPSVVQRHQAGRPGVRDDRERERSADHQEFDEGIAGLLLPARA